MQSSTPASATIAVVLSLSERPRVHTLQGALACEIVLGDEVFRDAGLGDWLGFYDWLRTRTGEVIGVRLWVDEPSPPLRAAGKCAGVVTGPHGSPMEIFFSAAREFEEGISDDQDFGSNMLLVSADKFALTFQSSELGLGVLGPGGEGRQ